METMMADPAMREWDARVRARASMRAEAKLQAQADELTVETEMEEAAVA